MKKICIFTAATKYGDLPALRFESRVWSFKQLAAECAPHCARIQHGPQENILSVRATNTPETIITVLAALHCRRTIAVLHPGSKNDISLTPSTARGFFNTTAPHCILFTSGSSAAPKGVVLPESALIASANASASNLGWQPNDQWILNLPLAHIGGLSILFRCLLAGKCVNLQQGFCESQVFNAIAEHGATMLSLVPTTLRRLMASTERNLLKKVRVVLLGGAAISDELRHQWQQQHLPVLETFGMTEASSQVATTPLSTAETGTRSGLMPLKGITVKIEDPKGHTLAANAEGRIRVSGPTVMNGYLNMPPADGTFLTSDLGFFDDDGYLHITGRADNLIITGGENVSPATVEKKLKQITGIEDAVVFGIPDTEYGQVVAAALFVNQDSFVEAQLADSIKKNVATYEKPRRICVASIDALPLLENGKIDRRQVVENFVKPN